MKLFYSRRSCAFAPHMLLFDADAQFESIEVDFENKEQNSDAFLRINPKARVPALQTAQGVLTENPAILLYIAQRYPDKYLVPSDPFLLAEAQAFNMYLASTVHVAHAHKHRGYRWVNSAEAQAAMTAKVGENMAECARMIEAHYFKGPYVLGQHYSICDPYLALIFRWLKADGVNVNHYAKLCEHHALMKTRESFQRVMALYD
jgi:glutathione S-transferase